LDAYEIEELTLKFLRDNDEHYTRKNKKKLMSHPYLSNKQFKARLSREIPASNLSNKQKLQSPKLAEPLHFS